MAKIILVRHGESKANKKGIYQGQTYDTGLSKLGQKQAVALAGRLTQVRVGKVITSPLKRACQTAEFIVYATGHQLTVDKRITETNHGLWEGKTKEWVKKHYPKLFAKWETQPTKVVFPQGEKFKDVVTRVEKFLQETEWGGTAVVVTHDNIIRVMVAKILDLPIDAMWNIPLDPTALTVLEETNGGLKLICLNDLNHLSNLRVEVAKQAL